MRTIDKINYYLAKKGKTGADLSRALGLSNSIYSQWNTGKSKPSKNKLPAIAEYLGVSVADLLPDSDEKPEKGAKKAPDPKIEGLSAEAQEILDYIRDATPAELAEVCRYIGYLKSKRGAE